MAGELTISVVNDAALTALVDISQNDLEIAIEREAALSTVVDRPPATLDVGVFTVEGPPGAAGQQGLPGRDGQDLVADPGDFTLIFENHLI